MCGIAGYSLSSESRIERTLAAQALLAGISERGADAVGFAHRVADGSVAVTKLRGGASALLDEISVPRDTNQALLHVRDYTKGTPDIEVNNHPIRHGAVVGVHNGVIANDDALLARYGIERETPEMTVDSEVIFALMERRESDGRALGELRGTMATAWLDERRPESLFLARGISRPLWLGLHGHRPLLRVDSPRACDRRGCAQAPARRTPGQGRAAARGRLAAASSRTRRFRPDKSYREEIVSPVHSPHEAVSCLAHFAKIAAAAA